MCEDGASHNNLYTHYKGRYTVCVVCTESVCEDRASPVRISRAPIYIYIYIYIYTYIYIYIIYIYIYYIYIYIYICIYICIYILYIYIFLCIYSTRLYFKTISFRQGSSTSLRNSQPFVTRARSIGLRKMKNKKQKKRVRV
jgi:hypothetical protein